MAAAAMLIVAGLIIADASRRHVRRLRFESEIRVAGGFAELPKSLLEAIQLWRKTGQFPNRRVFVKLYGSTFNNDWIRDHDYLRDFEIWFLQCDSITGDDLARLIDAHPLEVLNARDIVLTEEVLRAIRDNSTLTQVLLGESQYTDEQLAGLPLERLEHLSLAKTGVTPEGLLQVRRCRKLDSIALDGGQLTDETADVLASLGTVSAIHLFGPDVSDAHLQRLHRVASLTLVHASGTQVTEAGRTALATALPKCKVEVAPFAVD